MNYMVHVILSSTVSEHCITSPFTVLTSLWRLWLIVFNEHRPQPTPRYKLSILKITRTRNKKNQETPPYHCPMACRKLSAFEERFDAP